MKKLDVSDAIAPKFQIFRASTAPSAEEVGVLTVEGVTADVQKRVEVLVANGFMEGARSKVLFSFPGFSLIHYWFKRDFPLPLHTHDSDCLYYVIAGTTRVGTETLGPGDGLFVPKNVPYSHKAGPEGVEVLEFRHSEQFNFEYKAKGDSPFWDRALSAIVANKNSWLNARPPSVKNSDPSGG